MGKTTEDMTETDVNAAEPSGTTLPASAGTMPLGVQRAGALGGSTTEALHETRWEADAGHDEQHTPSNDDAAGVDEIEQTRAQIDQTRAHMSETIDAIQYKLSPEHIAQQAKDTVREATIGKAQDMVNTATDSAKGLSSGIVDTIKQNPIPAALAGLGIGWLLVSGRKSDAQVPVANYRYRSYDDRPNYGYDRSNSDGHDHGDNGGVSGVVEGVTNRVGTMAGHAQGAAGNMAGHVQETAGQMTSSVQDAAGQVAGTAQDLAAQAGQGISQIGSQAQQGAQRAQTGFQQMLRSNPMAVAAGAVALGLAVGLSIPETDKENELLGPKRDHLMDQAQQQVQQVAQKAQNVAQEAVGAAKDAAHQATSEGADSKQ